MSVSLQEKWKLSTQDLKRPRTVALTGLMIAINLTLDLMNVRITLAPQLRISFGFLTNAVTGMLFGPAAAMISGAVGDIVGLMLNPTGAYFPGFTLTAVLAGLVWGMMFYREKITWPRVIAARLIINLVLNTGLNGLWMWMLYHQSLFKIRAIKNILMIPIEAVLLMLVGKLISKVPQSPKR